MSNTSAIAEPHKGQREGRCRHIEVVKVMRGPLTSEGKVLVL